MIDLRQPSSSVERNPEFRFFFWPTQISRFSFAILLIICMISLQFSACGPGTSWSEALEETAPPDPESSSVSSAAESTTQAAESARGSESRAPSLSQPAEIESAPESDEEDPRPGATLEVVLAGDMDCFAGSVRCYVDGRYVGLVGEDGRFEVPVRPGDHLLVVWDNRGRWQAEFTAVTGQTVRIPIRCDDRPDQGAY